MNTAATTSTKKRNALLTLLRSAWLPKPTICCSLLALCLVFGWSRYIAHSVATADSLLQPLTTVESIAKKIVTEVAVRTDAGRQVTIAVPERTPTQEELEVAWVNDCGLTFECTDGPGADYNCHGWVFTGGRFWIDGRDVRHILNDNCYSAVDDPQTGDLIIYYRGEDIIHTGLVRSVDEVGVLIESKWGVRGRFIHAPGESVYDSDFRYYRSPRQGHLLDGIADVAAE